MPDPVRILQEAYDNVRHEYRTAIGQRRDELITPALVLDVDAAQRNIDHMASELRRMGSTTIRPHYKTHKSPDLARRQVQAGARGLSMATVWEAAVLAAAIAYLLSPDASYVTAATLLVDGGFIVNAEL